MKKLLIVVDYQYDFVEGSLGFPKAISLEDNIASKIDEYRSRGDEIIFTFDTHGENYLQTQEGKGLPIEHCILGTDGWNSYGKIKDMIQQGDKLIHKPAFGSAQLFTYLQGKEYESIELVGIVTNICVISNAVIVKTALPETSVLVDALCVASNDEYLNNAALDVMASLQIKIINR